MNEEKNKKGRKYLIIGLLVLFLSILGASVAYYLARVQGNLSGRAAGTELDVQVQKLSSNATGDLIPLDNDLETLNLAAAGYQDKGACVDINGYSVCQIYKITVTNNGSIDLKMNGTVTLSGQNTPNIDCATMSDATTVANNNSCMGGNVFVSGDTLAANSHNDYYVMVYINNLDEPQTDSGEFNGVVTFTTEDGRKVKGRFTKPFNLVERIETLYNVNNNDLVTTTTKAEVTNNSIVYNYATNVGLMKDRLGGTSATQDSGNIRYYGKTPNNYVDIGDVYEEDMYNFQLLNFESSLVCHESYNTHEEEGCSSNWQDWGYESEQACIDDYGDWWAFEYYDFTTVDEACDGITHHAGEPILWRIIGVFDGKLRIRRDEAINGYSFDTSASNINKGYGINEWSQADLMKLLNPGFDSNQDFDTDETTKITVNNSLYWNSGTGKCYNDSSYANVDCDFTNSGLSEEAKEYVIDQTLYLGGFESYNVFANDAWESERGNNVFNSTKECYGKSGCNDTVTRTTSWTGKVGLIYPSDYGYASDFRDSNCQSTLTSQKNCTENWMSKGQSFTISPSASFAGGEVFYFYNDFEYSGICSARDGVCLGNAFGGGGGWPTLLLDSSVLAESGNGSKEHPYVLTQ